VVVKNESLFYILKFFYFTYVHTRYYLCNLSLVFTVVTAITDVTYSSKYAFENSAQSVTGSVSGLPDGLFSNRKSKFGYILDGLALEDVGIFYGHLVHLWSFLIFNGHLVYFVVIWYIFPHFGISYQEKAGNPCLFCLKISSNSD
jgi:hypothetical protein